MPGKRKYKTAWLEPATSWNGKKSKGWYCYWQVGHHTYKRHWSKTRVKASIFLMNKV